MRHFQTAIEFERAAAFLEDSGPIEFGRAINGSQGFVCFGEIGIELERALRGLRFVGADLVEVSPPYDSAELTSLLAANLLYEILCLLA